MQKKSSQAGFWGHGFNLAGGWTLVAAACSVALTLVYALLKPAGAAFVWQTHAEGVSLSTYGKWPAADWPVDGFSGEFPSFYNYVSDYLASGLASVWGMPEFHFQALWYGPFLSGAMLLVNFLCLSSVLKSRAKALVASLLISYGTDLTIPDAVYAWAGEPHVGIMKARMHVPFLAMPLATGQSLGWFLFVPALTFIFNSVTRNSIVWALLAGTGLGLLFQTHTLTFLNVATAGCLFIYAYSLSIQQPRSGFFLVRLLGPAVLLIVLSYRAVQANTGFSIHSFALLWLALVVSSVASRRQLLLLGAMGLGALAASFHYVAHLLASREFLASMGALKTGGMVHLPSVILYFFPLWLATGGALLFMRWKGDAGLLWGVCMLVATFALSIGSYWGFENHPYRMSINLIFPLSILFAAFSLWERLPLRARSAWLGIVLILVAVAVVRNVHILYGKHDAVARLGQTPKYYGLVAPSDEEARFFRAIAANLSGAGKVLLPPEHGYPVGAMKNSLILGLSRLPAFIPDYRFISWRDLHAQRVGLYCFLFPGFPHWDYPHFGRPGFRYCQGIDAKSLDGAGAITPIDDRVRADVLSLYDIRFVAHWMNDATVPLNHIARRHGLEPLYESEGKGLFAVSRPAGTPVRAGFAKAAYAGSGEFTFEVRVPRADCYVFVFSGPGLAQSTRAIHLSGSPVAVARLGSDAVHFDAHLDSGTSRMSFMIPADERYARTPPTPIFFAAGIPAAQLDQIIQFREPRASGACL